jgi:poly(hydroxyalkanoate) granule-associated protein
MSATGPSEKTAKTAPDKATPEADIARKIWLAGVGAYDRIYAETQGVVEKLTATAGETFEELVAKGEEVEERVRKSISKSPNMEKVAQAVENATAKAQSFQTEQRAALEARFEKVRETVSETLAPWNLPAIGQALEKLTAQVEALTHEVAALKADRAAASKPAKKNPAA